jgi:hypothetical protein
MKKLLADPELRRKLIVHSTIATQAREGIDVSEAEAEDSYYVVTEAERAAFFGLLPFRSEAGEADGRHVEFVKGLGRPTPSRQDLQLKIFGAIPDAALAYNKVELLGHFFTNFPKLSPSFAEAKQGLIATSSERFVRRWWEPSKHSARDWKPFAKGGDFSRFYSDIYLVFDWTANGRDIKELSARLYGSASRTIKCEEYYFRPGITWVRKTVKGLNARILPAGAIFNDTGPTAFPKNEADRDFLLGLLNSDLAQAIVNCLGTRSWDVAYVGAIPVAYGSAEDRKAIGRLASDCHSIKREWDNGNEISTIFTAPWITRYSRQSLPASLDAILNREQELDAHLAATFASLNEKIFRAYDISGQLRKKIEDATGERPPELVWPQMEGKDTDQKRREHVDRLLTYSVKQILEDDEDHLVCLQRVAHEAPLLERVREKLAACFPEQDPSALETEVVNELKKKTRGYHRAESLSEWLHDVFFETHNALYQQRPILWHLASSQTRTEPGFACLVHAHHFDADALAKLRSVYVKDRITVLRREAAQAGQDGKADRRLDLLALAEEVEAYDAKLAQLQEGAHTGPEGGDRDYCILTPWKTPAERPKGWNPDIDDGIKVNLAPLARTKLLRINLKLGMTDNDE